MRFYDNREPSEIKSALFSMGWQGVAMETGDYCFPSSTGDLVVIERKTIKQLLDDMVEGQLSRQARKVVESCPFPILLIEGHWRLDGEYLLDSKYTWNQSWNELQSLQDLGLRLQLTHNTGHTIQRLQELSTYYSKSHHSSIERHPSGDYRIAVLSMIKGIDTSKAKGLLAGMGALAGIAGAGEEELMKIDGIGPILAKRIREFFQHRD